MRTELVQFVEKDDTENTFYGIIVDDTRLICLCCGGVMEMDDVLITKRYPVFPSLIWAIAEDLGDLGDQNPFLCGDDDDN